MVINSKMKALRMTSQYVTEKKSYKKRRERYCLLARAGVDDFTRYCLTGLHPDLKEIGRVSKGSSSGRGIHMGHIERYLIKLTG